MKLEIEIVWTQQPRKCNATRPDPTQKNHFSPNTNTNTNTTNPSSIQIQSSSSIPPAATSAIYPTAGDLRPLLSFSPFAPEHVPWRRNPTPRPRPWRPLSDPPRQGRHGHRRTAARSRRHGAEVELPFLCPLNFFIQSQDEDKQQHLIIKQRRLIGHHQAQVHGDRIYWWPPAPTFHRWVGRGDADEVDFMAAAGVGRRTWTTPSHGLSLCQLAV